ncbi:PrsW family glutamic-type intramembrane protease [Streptomyces antioxidans]|uniref:CdiA C-terminal domain-containing protein n=1 Tax=Streptomyces antioxidans TaxID=1507734 RepID=UPI000A5ECC05|nr:PrsW family glutamic-type intramembrane protease [Streptomyces antioxidans]
MVAASVYGVVQLLALSSPTRSVRMSTVLLAIAAGVYGAGVAAALLELAYTRGVAEATGESLTEVVKSASYAVDPVIEELMKLAPLLFVAWNVRIRRQWGLTDYVVLGAALGAGFGLLEAVARYGLDADRAIPHPTGGWAVPDSLRAPYIPGAEQVFSTWFPAPQWVLELGDRAPAAATSPHLVYTAMAALGVGVLLRGRGWARALGVLPLAATSGLHMLTNYAAAHPTDRDAAERVDTFEGMLWAVPLVCLAVAMVVDLRQLWRGKTVVPGVLLQAERAGRTGLGALAAYGAWCVPWSTLIALRFARLRRSLLYGAAGGAPPYPGAESLHRTVAWSAAQVDASDRQHAWWSVDLRAVARAAGTLRDRRRKWYVLVSVALAIPALLLLAIGSFPSAADLQQRFASGTGLRVLVGFGIAGLLWTGWMLVRLLRAQRASLALPHGEALATIRFRVWTALGGCVVGALLLSRLADGMPPGGPVIRNLHLLDALNNFLDYLGFALLLLSLLALISPGGGLGLALAGARVGTTVITREAAIHAAAYGALGVVLMSAAADGSGGGGAEGDTAPGRSQGEGAIDETEKAFSPKERRIAETLQSEGKDVKALKESPVDGIKTPDALVDGVPTEFKTLQPGAASNAVKNTLNTAKKQSRDAVVDARGSGLDESAAREGMGKFLRNNPPGRMSSIRIIGDGYNINWP